MNDVRRELDHAGLLYPGEPEKLLRLFTPDRRPKLLLWSGFCEGGVATGLASRGLTPRCAASLSPS
jgi:hypothetical protein